MVIALHGVAAVCTEFVFQTEGATVRLKVLVRAACMARLRLRSVLHLCSVTLD